MPFDDKNVNLDTVFPCFLVLCEIVNLLMYKERTQILRILKKKPLSAGVLTSQLGISRTAVMEHLNALKSKDLVLSDKRGPAVYWKLNRKMLERWEKIANVMTKALQDFWKER